MQDPRGIREQKRFYDKENLVIKTETKHSNGMRVEEEDKKQWSKFYHAMGIEVKQIFCRSFTKHTIFRISFKELWECLKKRFLEEGKKLERFSRALTEMRKKC